MIKSGYKPKLRNLVSLLAGGLLVASIANSQAASVTFAQFQQDVSGNQFKYTGVAPPGTSTLASVGASIPVQFTFKDFFGGPLMGTPTLNTVYEATLTVAGTATLGEVPGGSGKNPFDTLKLVFTGDGTDPATFAAGLGGKNLLTLLAGSGVGTAGQLNATAGDQSGTLSGSEPTKTVGFTSDIIKFLGVTEQNYALAFSSVTPAFSYIGFPSSYLDSFTAAGAGTFAATPTIPEPGVITLLASVALTGAALRLRRRRA